MSFSDPKHNLEQLGLKDGHIVADLGSGSGFYSIESAKMVAPSGVVYAIDVQKTLLERLKKEAIRMKVNGIQVIAGDLEIAGGSKLKDKSVDRVIVSNILFQLENKENIAREASRILKDDGLILVVDWSASFGNLGPHNDHVFYKDDCAELFKSIGLVFVREIEAGENHYGLVFRK